MKFLFKLVACVIVIGNRHSLLRAEQPRPSPHEIELLKSVTHGVLITVKPAHATHLDKLVGTVMNRSKHVLIINMQACKNLSFNAMVTPLNAPSADTNHEDEVSALVGVSQIISDGPDAKFVVDHKDQRYILKPNHKLEFNLSEQHLLQKIRSMARHAFPNQTKFSYIIQLGFDNLIAGVDGSIATDDLFNADFHTKFELSDTNH